MIFTTVEVGDRVVANCGDSSFAFPRSLFKTLPCVGQRFNLRYRIARIYETSYQDCLKPAVLVDIVNEG